MWQVTLRATMEVSFSAFASGWAWPPLKKNSCTISSGMHLPFGAKIEVKNWTFFRTNEKLQYANVHMSCGLDLLRTASSGLLYVNNLSLKNEFFLADGQMCILKNFSINDSVQPFCSFSDIHVAGWPQWIPVSVCNYGLSCVCHIVWFLRMLRQSGVNTTTY